MAEGTELRRLLILHGPSLRAGGIVDFLREHFELELVQDLDGALAAMRSGPFDAVLAETGDFLPLERGVVTQQASIILDTLGDGVCIVGPSGELVWANRRLRDYPPGVVDPLRKLCVQAYEELAAASGGGERGRRFSLMPGDGAYYEVICSPVRDREGLLRQVAAVVVNATAQRRQQLKLNAIDRAGRELVRLDRDRLTEQSAAERFRTLRERIIRCSRDVLDFQHFAVLLLDDETNRLELVVSEGLDVDGTTYYLFASTADNGICGYVAATGRSYVCPDVRRDPHYLPGLKGARSSLTVPLRLHDKVVGVVNVESDLPGAFGEEDRQFAEILANHVALALHILNLLVSERRTAHTEISGTMCAELTGPLNDIMAEAAELKDDYIGHDDLRRRLDSIIDRVSGTRAMVRKFARSPAAGMLSAGPNGREPDPALAGRVVLVADDEEVIRQTVRDVLTACGCRVDVACDGAEAREHLARRRYDLVISDIKMPGADGYEVLAAAKAAHPDTRVILVTAFGYDPHHSVVRASREGLSAVLLKPFKVHQLLEQCRTALRPDGA